MVIVPGSEDIAATGGGTPGTVYYVVRRVPPITGRDLRTAQPSLDQNNLPAVGFSLSRDGAVRFGQLTEQNINRQLAIILDNRVISAPVIQSRITDQGQITGGFDQQRAQDLALVLRSGALPAPMDFLEERTVGPSLGADSIRAGVTASVVGLVLVVLFMLGYYKLAGFNALTSIVVNLLILLGMMAYLGATMTLPGFAGFVLTIGMGVDSNVLIFERIKEELATAKGVQGRRERGVRPRLVDDRRHTRRLAHRRAAPAQFRHRPDPRFCAHADHRPRVECLHRCLRFANDVRADAVAPRTGADTEYLGLCSFSRLRISTSSGGGGMPSGCRSSSSLLAPP